MRADMQSGDWTLGLSVMVKEIEQSEDDQQGFWTATIHSLEIELNNESSLSTFKSDEILMENSSRCTSK